MVKARGEFTVAPLSDGSDGRGVVSVTTYFLATNLSTGVTTKTSGWGVAFQPLTATKRYLWEYTVTAYDSGSPTTTTPVIKGVYGDKGDDGVSITSMSEEYYYSTSSTTQTGGVWSTTVPDWVDGKYLWLRIKTVYSNSDIGYTKPMNVTGQKGEAGSQGKDKFLWIKYADDEKGSGMSDSGIDKRYIGVSPNQLSEKESDNPSDYKWSPMYDLGALDDITLADKTEILSGTEIFTDKADDSVVHVDIDGNSYQHAGSGKNLFYPDIATTNKMDYNQSHITKSSFYATNGWSTCANRFPIEGNIKLTISMWVKSKVNGTIIALHPVQYNSLTGSTRTSAPSSAFMVTDNWERIEYTVTTGVGTVSADLYLNTNTSGAEVWVNGVQIEKNATATAYEPPAPTPDYPIEIHSLNDFDVLSSVGRRNYILNSPTSKGTRMSLFGTSISLNQSDWKIDGDHYIVEALSTSETYHRFLTPVTKSEYGEWTFSGEIFVPATTTGEPTVRSQIAVGHTNGWVNTGGSGEFAIPHKKEEWVPFKHTFNIIEDTYQIHVGLKFKNGSQLVGDKFYYRNWKFEKTEGTPYTPAPEDITEDSNHPLIDKTNILLSEPLRSVGDVKDRMFRDSDGLWKVERNVAEKIFDGTESISVYPDVQPDTYAFYYTDNGNITGIINGSGFSSHFLREQGDIGSGGAHVVNKECYSANLYHLKFSISKNRLSSLNISGIKTWLSQENAKGTPLSVIYKSRGSSIETLPQADQDKLNNIASFKGDNYVYTVFDKSDILAPELHATFKSKAWYRNFKTDSNIVNSQADKFKNAQQEKKVLDERYKEIYAHSKLSGNVKTALYNAKVAYNTVFMALEVSLQHYIREKTEVRLSELEAIYSGGNGYVSAKAKLEVALDNAQSNITDGITNDKTGRNKWIGKKYTWTDTVRVAPKLSHIRGLEPVETTAVDDTKKFTFNDDKYLAHFFTYLYLDKAKTIVTTVAHDDSFTMLVNGQEIVSTSQTIPTPYAVSIPLSKGWNQIDMLLQEFTGGDHITLGHELSTLVDDMSCYLGGGFSASQIRQLSDEIDMRVQEGNVINAINISTEGIRLEGKKVSIDGNTEFKKDLIMKSGVIQSADGGTRLDLNNNTFTFNKPFTIGSSQVATDKDVKDSIDNLEIGGRNLIKNSNNFTNFGGYSGAKSTFEENVRVPEWGAYDATRIVISGGSSNLKTTPQIYATVGSQVNYSFWAKNMGTKDISFKFNGLNGASEIVLAVDESKRISVFGKMRATIDWFQHQIYTHFSADSVDIILWRSKLEYGNKATDYTPAPEDIDLAISESQKSAEAVAVAKANLAETNAKAHADGKVTAEEKARIAQAQANLKSAMAEAKSKADEAERLSKEYANSQISKLPTWEKNYAVSTLETSPLSKKNGSPLDELSSYEVVGKVTSTGTDTYAYAVFRSKSTDGISGMGWELEKIAENGTHSNHIEFFLDENGIPSVRLYSHTSRYNVRIIHNEYIGGDTPYLMSKKASEAVAIAKANLAEINAKAHADGKVTAEERARIAQAQANLNSAMAEAKKKADEAERLAKAYADAKANDALAQAKTDATTKANEAKKSAENLAIAKANLAEVNAKAHADGKVTAEEKARIAQAQTNLNTAMAEAKKKADEAERLAKAYAELQVDNIQIGGRNLLVLNNKESLGSHSPYNTQWSIEGNKVRTSIERAGLNLTMSHELSMSFSESIEYTTSGYIKVNETIPSVNIFNGNNINTQKGQVVSFKYDPKTGYFSTTKYGAVNSWFIHANTTLQAGDVLEISSLMIEKGNKASDWSPAPEDVDLAIDNKSDKETTDGLEKALEDLNDVVADIGVDGIREQLVEYQSVLNDVGNDSKNAKDRLEKLLDPANGELNALTVALNELSQRWKTQDGFIQINGDETELSITKGDVSMILGSDGLIFYSGGEAVATINGQYLRIDRGIFAESLHVGRHQWSPLASNRDHFVLSYTTDVRDV